MSYLNCPYCGKNVYIDDKIEEEVEDYYSTYHENIDKRFVQECSECDSKFYVYPEVDIAFDYYAQADEELNKTEEEKPIPDIPGQNFFQFYSSNS